MKSLRARLTLAIGGTGTLLTAGLCAVAYLQGRSMLTEQFDEELRTRGAALISQLDWSPDGTAKLDYRGEYMPENELAAGGHYFALWLERDGTLIEQSHSLGKAQLPRFPAGQVRVFSLPNGTEVRGVSLLAPFAPQLEGKPDRLHAQATNAEPGAVVVIAEDTREFTGRLKQLTLELAGIATAGLLIMAGMVRFILRRALSPLIGVSEMAARMDSGSLHERFPSAGVPSELTPICARMNELFERLQDSFVRERRFSADVAHELRTPIAELLSLAGAGHSMVSADSESAAFFADAAAIAHQMSGTITTLLLLSRCESGAEPIEPESFSAAPFLEELRAAFAPRAGGIVFTVQCQADVVWHTDAALLLRLLHLLLDNAISYTPHGGHITVRAETGRISVTNGPVNLTPDDLPRLKERFWRKDPARSSGAHAGLGLALAAELARLLRAPLNFMLSAERDLSAVLEWPVPEKEQGPPCISPSEHSGGRS